MLVYCLHECLLEPLCHPCMSVCATMFSGCWPAAVPARTHVCITGVCKFYPSPGLEHASGLLDQPFWLYYMCENEFSLHIIFTIELPSYGIYIRTYYVLKIYICIYIHIYPLSLLYIFTTHAIELLSYHTVYVYGTYIHITYVLKPLVSNASGSRNRTVRFSQPAWPGDATKYQITSNQAGKLAPGPSSSRTQSRYKQ